MSVQSKGSEARRKERDRKGRQGYLNRRNGRQIRAKNGTTFGTADLLLQTSRSHGLKEGGTVASSFAFVHREVRLCTKSDANFQTKMRAHWTYSVTAQLIVCSMVKRSSVMQTSVVASFVKKKRGKNTSNNKNTEVSGFW